MNEYEELTSALVIFVDKFIRDIDKLFYYLNKLVLITKNKLNRKCGLDTLS